MIARIAIAVFSLLTAFQINALTVHEVLDKAASKISTAKGISCNFTISQDGKSTKGTLKSSGNKFTIQTPANSTWYNGKTMYTFSASTSETTVVNPTVAELAEVNPLNYLKGYKKTYNASFAKKMPKGVYVIELTPIKRSTGIKKITVSLESSNFIPKSFVINGAGGSVSVAISEVKLGTVLGASVFEYPKNKFPKAEIVDLR